MGVQLITISVLLILATGACNLSLLSDSRKTSESIAIPYVRSDEITSRFQKVNQPLELNYQWKNNGIILKSGKGKTAKRQYIDGRTGKTEKSVFLNPEKEEGNSLFIILVNIECELKL